MTATCPRGHESQTADWCDQCGAPIGAASEELETSPSARREPCPACGTTRSGDDRYCESCGYDFENPAPAAPSWEAVATADRAQFDRLAVDGVTFPDSYLERRFSLRAGENRIGRSRGQPGEEAPEIDLATPPLDPGISRLHAMLEFRADGTCVLRDLQSTNGTAVNDAPASIAPQTDVPLSDGDRIHVGVWTTITLVRGAQKS